MKHPLAQYSEHVSAAACRGDLMRELPAQLLVRGPQGGPRMYGGTLTTRASLAGVLALAVFEFDEQARLREILVRYAEEDALDDDVDVLWRRLRRRLDELAAEAGATVTTPSVAGQVVAEWRLNEVPVRLEHDPETPGLPLVRIGFRSDERRVRASSLEDLFL